MKIDSSLEDQRFRAEMRSFFAEEYPQRLIQKVQRGQRLTKQDYIEAERALAARGWLAPGWPREFGGTGWTAKQRFIFDDELERAGAPALLPFGLLYVAPVIYTFGTDEQKARWLPDILASRTHWAQGYSEPEAGSDLASLRTRAERAGDKYIVNGTKIWTSFAHFADWIFCLVRTSDEPRKQDGISFLCIDLRTPGVTIEPIASIDGSHDLNRVIFDNAEVPMSNRIGDEGKGWTYAKFLLNHERTSYAHVAGKREAINRLKKLVANGPWGDISGEAGGALVRRISEAEISLLALEHTALRALAGDENGGAASGIESSFLKILATTLAQEINEIFLDLGGPATAVDLGERDSDDWYERYPGGEAFVLSSMSEYFFNRAQSIYGGSTEIQKNIIARELIGF